MLVVVDLRQRRHVVRALRDRRHLAEPRLPALELGLLQPTSVDVLTFAGSFGLFFTLFLLFVRFLPMVGMAEVKGVMPAAAPRTSRGTATTTATSSTSRKRRGGLRVDRCPAMPTCTATWSTFDNVDDLLAGASKVRDAGYTSWDAHTPFPVHGLDAAMGIRRTRLPCVVLAGGLTGAAAGLLLQWWMNAVDYPFLISGKPLFSLPANIPVDVRADRPVRGVCAPARHARVQRAAAALPPASRSRALPAGHRRPLLHLRSRRAIRGSTARDPGAAGVARRHRRSRRWRQ